MDFMNLLRPNLQFFSQDDTGGSNPSDDNVDDTKDDQQDDQTNDKDKDDKPKDNEPKFTQEQLDDIVKERIKRAEQDKQEAIKEAEKLAKMNTDEKREYEFEKLQEENKRLLAEQNKYSLGKEATKMLADSGIIADDEILDFVVKEDAETTNEAVKAFSDLVDKISDERMKEKLKGTSPKKQKGAPGAVTKESIMSIKDTSKRLKAIQDNPQLFN